MDQPEVVRAWCRTAKITILPSELYTVMCQYYGCV